MGWSSRIVKLYDSKVDSEKCENFTMLAKKRKVDIKNMQCRFDYLQDNSFDIDMKYDFHQKLTWDYVFSKAIDAGPSDEKFLDDIQKVNKLDSVSGTSSQNESEANSSNMTNPTTRTLQASTIPTSVD